MSTPPLPRPPEEVPRGEEPERLRALAEAAIATRRKYVPGTPEKYTRTEIRGVSVLDFEWLLAEVERLARVLTDAEDRATSHFEHALDLDARRLKAEAQAERLAGERDEWKRAAFNAEQRIITAEAECERLAGRVAALKVSLRALVDAAGREENIGTETWEAWDEATRLLADVGGSE